MTILCNKYDGHPKGFAYVEFGDKDSVQTAMALDESLFRGRQIKVSCYKTRFLDWLIYLLLFCFCFFQVMLKRTNRPGITSSNRAPRGTRGSRGVRGARPFASFGFRPMRRPRFEWNDVNIDPPSQLINFNHSFLLVFSEEGGRLFLLHIKTRTCLLTYLVFTTRDNLVGYINWDDGKKELMAE